MEKLIVLELDGDFTRGFRVTLTISSEGKPFGTKIIGELPPAIELAAQYSNWQSMYRSLGRASRAIKPKIIRIDACLEKEKEELCDRLNQWLRAKSFLTIREEWLASVNPSDEVRVLIHAKDHQIWQLPWHQWDFLLKHYSQIEIGFSPLEYREPPKTQAPLCRDKVNILAILGNSEGINIDEDRQYLTDLPGAETTFLVKPQRRELNDQLWQQHWDILFFAGHSRTEGQSGRIYLNTTESLTIGELSYALQNAIAGGLQLAIFNSCDGLGLARELEKLNIPQLIVMREPVPDEVAQEFLKYFLESFARDKSLYQAVQEARQRLQGLEEKFPCASWLPVICQNPATEPFRWSAPPKLPHPTLPAFPLWHYLRTVLVISLAVTSVVMGMRSLGLLQAWELQAYDYLMRLRPDPGLDKRLLIVTVNDKDVQQFGKPLSDRTVDRLLTKLENYQPRAIGLDIYRDSPQKEGWDNLVAHLQKSDRIVALCKVGEPNGSPPIAPPPGVPSERLGFSDALVPDSDGTIRRYVLAMDIGQSPCTTPYAFSFQLVRRYLPPNTRYGFNPGSNLSIGAAVFPVVNHNFGGYQLSTADVLGYQVLIDYRSSVQVAQEVSLTEVLTGRDSDLLPWVKDRIVLIGYVGENTKDYHSTPLGKRPGVIVHAHMVSQILSVVLERRSVLSSWWPMGNTLWVWGWALAGGLIAWRFRSSGSLKITAAVVLAALGLSCFGFLIQTAWVPVIPAALALVTTGSVVVYTLSPNQKL